MSTLFSLEAIFAKKGDALILHYGPFEDPKMILIDGGPSGVYTKFMKPRIAQLRDELGLARDDPFPVEMLMVSHIDDDHVNGVLRLMGEQEKAKSRNRPLPYAIGTLWHNSFDDLLGNDEREIVSRMAATAAGTGARRLALPASVDPDLKAVAASVGQGRDLRRIAKKLRVPVNRPFTGLVMAPASRKIDMGHGLELTVVGPLKTQVQALQKKWDQDLKKILKKEKESARSQAFADRSAANLASICVLAEMKRKKMLLTGDARGDFVLEGLEAAGVLKKNRPLRLDVLKVPHHGSDNNVTDDFFARLPADHYVLSGDGEHGNPEREVLEMIVRGRGTDAAYTLHFTTHADAHRHERDHERKTALKRVDDWIRNDKPAKVKVRHRKNDDATFSIAVDLGKSLGI